MFLHIITRKQAKSLGLKTFFTGKQCKYDHICERYVCDRKCLECVRQYFNNNKQHRLAVSKVYYENNKEVRLAYCAHRKAITKERTDQQNKRYYEDNKEVCLERNKQYKKNNVDRSRSWNSKRRAKLKQAYPRWAEIEKDEIQQLYAYAKQLESITDTKWHVDHIVPLNHELVCGLHCLANLQVMPKTKNLEKSNNFIIG